MKQLNETVNVFKDLMLNKLDVQVIEVEKPRFIEDKTYVCNDNKHLFFKSIFRYGECLPPYGETNEWYDVLMTLKKKHAVHVGRAMNIFVGCQQKASLVSASLSDLSSP